VRLLEVPLEADPTKRPEQGDRAEREEHKSDGIGAGRTSDRPERRDGEQDRGNRERAAEIVRRAEVPREECEKQ